MFGFKKKCPVCGMTLEKEKGIKRSGKVFCSARCADEYEKALEKQKKRACCCCR